LIIDWYNHPIQEELMSQTITPQIAGFLELPMVSHIRRNHGLEHATLHILSNYLPHTMLMGHSDINGFWIIGDVPSELLHSAVQEAITRLRAGEAQLAIHPNCGTNYVTAGVLAGLAGASAMFTSGKRWQDRLARLPFAAALATIALIASQPLGLALQRAVTTSGEPGSLEVVSITHRVHGRITSHRIVTRG
jgi:hypothetical protein